MQIPFFFYLDFVESKTNYIIYTYALLCIDLSHKISIE